MTEHDAVIILRKMRGELVQAIDSHALPTGTTRQGLVYRLQALDTIYTMVVLEKKVEVDGV